MNNSSLPVHWRFASGQAFAKLRRLVYAFDFARSANSHTYAEIDPSDLIEVIDGFLGEADGVVFGGDRADLQRLRTLLVDRIKPAHEHGLTAGRCRWLEGDHVYGSLSNEALHELALRLGPNDEMLRGWFAEGFCYAYSFEEMQDSLRKASAAESDSGVNS